MRLAVFVVFHLGTSIALADDLQVPRDKFEFDPQLTGRGEKMNYGPFLSTSVHNGQRQPGKDAKDPGKLDPGLRQGEPAIHLKTINVYLGGKYAAAFDTELCSYVAAWRGGFLDISRTNLNGYKGADLAGIRLPAMFQIAPLPGWSLSPAAELSDPRTAQIGALPKELAHYKGLYVHGWRTILSYSVGTSRVLDMPEMLVKDKKEAFCRTIRFDALNAKHGATMFLGDLPEAEGSVRDGMAVLTRKDLRLTFAAWDAPAGSRLEIVKDRHVVLRLAPSQHSFTFRLFVTRDLDPKGLQEFVGNVPPPANLLELCKGGPPRWKEEVVTAGKLGANDGAYTVDRIALPEKNPWNSWMRPGAFDFFADGRAALCTWNGDVFLVSGLDDDLKRVTWKRCATGLFEPLGLKIVKEQIYVLGRDQITRLHDFNQDGEADFYENFNNDGPTAPSFHSFAMELHTDRAGNFYYSRGAHRVQPGTPMHGGIIKVAKDGSKAELLGSGLREANGIGIGPDDLLTAADNQGDWVPSSKIDIIRREGFYGYVWGKKKADRQPDSPLCWIPHQEDNSSGGQVWVTSDKWGPFQGKMLHTAYGSSKLFAVLMQRDGERYQGGVVAFPLTFSSGIMRGRFNPRDGQLYVCGLKGWGTNAKDDGCFERVRYTDKPVLMPVAFRVQRDAIEIDFAEPLDAAKTEVAVEQWNYRWTSAYGSKDYSVAEPNKVGRDSVRVASMKLSDDRKTLRLEVPGLKPVMQMKIDVKGRCTIYNTINFVP